MPLAIAQISAAQAGVVLNIQEGQFADIKAKDVLPAKLAQSISAFANSDGGELYIGISEEIVGIQKIRRWAGFADVEAANAHLQVFESLLPFGTDLQLEFLATEDQPGLVLHLLVGKSAAIVRATKGIPYKRVGAQNIPVTTSEALRRLEYTKGIYSFENEVVRADPQVLLDSSVTQEFVDTVIPSVEPSIWLKKQRLIVDEAPTVAGILLFAEEPQAVLPKRSGIKVYRYKTSEPEGTRSALAFDPKTVEGCLYHQIRTAVELTKQIAEATPKLGDSALEPIEYPTQTLHEIITNAVIHRDYSIADDIHIRIFDNRIEVQNPGRLPAHITVENILAERFARNGTIVRILNKFPDPPNKDVGEGLTTAFRAMHLLGLREPIIKELDSSVLVIIRHEILASPQEAIMRYLEQHPFIGNAKAREITHVSQDHQMKAIFGRMVQAGLIEVVPGTRTSATAYRKVVHRLPDSD